MNPRLDHLLSMFQQDAEDSFILFALAKEYQQQNDLNLAEKYFLKLLNIDPEYVGLYYHLAQNYVQKNMPDQAKQVYIKGIEVAQKLGDSHAESELRNALVNLELDL